MWHKGPGYDIHRAVYEVTIYVKPVNLGGGVYEGWNTTIDILQSVLDALADLDNNSLSTGTYQAYVTPSRTTPLVHGGLEVIAYPPQLTGMEGVTHYFGFRVQVPVNEQWSQT